MHELLEDNFIKVCTKIMAIIRLSFLKRIANVLKLGKYEGACGKKSNNLYIKKTFKEKTSTFNC